MVVKLGCVHHTLVSILLNTIKQLLGVRLTTCNDKAIQTSCAMGLKFQEYISISANDHSYGTNSLTRLKQRICESQKTRYKTYMDINPRLISCPLYSAKDN